MNKTGNGVDGKGVDGMMSNVTRQTEDGSSARNQTRVSRVGCAKIIHKILNENGKMTN